MLIMQIIIKNIPTPSGGIFSNFILIFDIAPSFVELIECKVAFTTPYIDKINADQVIIAWLIGSGTKPDKLIVPDTIAANIAMTIFKSAAVFGLIDILIYPKLARLSNILLSACVVKSSSVKLMTPS